MSANLCATICCSASSPAAHDAESGSARAAWGHSLLCSDCPCPVQAGSSEGQVGETVSFMVCLESHVITVILDLGTALLFSLLFLCNSRGL
jgi:hypothetical protein